MNEKKLPLYQVIDWNKHFENAKSRSYAKPQFVCVPNKHGGTGLSNVQSEPDGAAIYGVWVWIIQLCSRQSPPREGWLTADGKKNGRRLTARELSNIFRRPIEEIHRCLQVIQGQTVAFIQLMDGQPEHTTGAESDTVVSDEETDLISDGHHDIPNEVTERTEQNRTEGKDSVGEVLQIDTNKAVNGEHVDTTGAESDTVVSDEETDLIQHAEAKRLVGELATVAFDRKLREADWRNPEKNRWLDSALPIARSDWQAVEWLYRLPEDDEALKRTARCQSFEAFLENLSREIDKSKSVRKQLGLNGFFGGEMAVEPGDGWTLARRERFVAKFGEDRELPKKFADLGASVCRQLDAEVKEK